ncbi:MAG TPA: hypothetical protein VGP12_07595 [Nitrosospira sp.]|nr:hypothetical protein [Nitrosospira sp.]
MNTSLIDELRLVVARIVQGVGKAQFKDVRERHVLTFLEPKLLKSGMVRPTYSV